MKKITLITLFFVLPMLAIGQTFNFNGTDDGFDQSAGATLSTTATFLQVDLTEGANNPNFGTTNAGVDGTTNFLAGVTIKNGAANGPTLMRVSYPKETGGRRYVNLDITAGDTEYTTYWFDLTNADWAGTEDDIKVHFKSAGNTDYTVPAGGVTIEVDKIQFVAEVPRVEKLVYEFNTNGDDEGWSNLVDATSIVAGGNLTITPGAPGAGIAKVTNGVNSVNADENSHMHIVYKNESALNNQLRIQFRTPADAYTGYWGNNQSINQNMSGFETLTIDLSSVRPDEWTGLTQDFQIAIRNTDNTGNASSAGDLVIDRIVFNNSATLTVDQFDTTSVAVYPNPANAVVNVTGFNNLSKVELFDITGKRVLETSTLTNNQLNVASFNPGIYLLRLSDVNNNILVKKLIIQ